MLAELVQTNEHNQDFIKGLVLSRVYERNGKKYIQAGNHRLDFKAEFEFLGFTKKADKIIFAETCTDFKKQYAKIGLREFNHVDGRSFFTIYLYFQGCNYIERLEEVEL